MKSDHYPQTEEAMARQSSGSKESVRRSREVNLEEAEEYLQRPKIKTTDPNKGLRKSYKKQLASEKKYSYIEELKKYRRNEVENDSISEHGGTDDEDFVLERVKSKRKGKLSEPKTKGRRSKPKSKASKKKKVAR